jgi:hypothetical protein
MHRRPSRTRARAFTPAGRRRGCPGRLGLFSSDADKAGGTKTKPPVMLTWPTTSRARRKSSPGSRRSSDAPGGGCASRCTTAGATSGRTAPAPSSAPRRLSIALTPSASMVGRPRLPSQSRSVSTYGWRRRSGRYRSSALAALTPSETTRCRGHSAGWPCQPRTRSGPAGRRRRPCRTPANHPRAVLLEWRSRTSTSQPRMCWRSSSTGPISGWSSANQSARLRTAF